MNEEKFNMQDPDELRPDDLNNLHIHPNNEVNYEKAMEHPELYRKEQIDELKKMKEELTQSNQGRSR